MTNVSFSIVLVRTCILCVHCITWIVKDWAIWLVANVIAILDIFKILSCALILLDKRISNRLNNFYFFPIFELNARKSASMRERGKAFFRHFLLLRLRHFTKKIKKKKGNKWQEMMFQVSNQSKTESVNKLIKQNN